ncbi:MAG: restriction endonuclease [Gemmatimonadota bacterium]|nr:restriction endonuclease [Gemmatimonadota bacterium]
MLDFRTEFERIFEEHNISYDVKGIITADKKIYSLGTDSKVLSTVFELLVRPVIYQVAQQNGMIVREAKAQNYYPDFTLMEDEADDKKIAVDVKTTYRSQERSKVSFTLGGYTSFIRSETKNIEFPYSQYAEEWVIGFIYTRQPFGDEPNHIYDLERLDEIPLPFEDVSYFVARKWKIAGDSAGSGNTANIGSISGDLDDFRSEAGPFQSKEEFLEYWRNYERTASEREGKYSNLSEFRIWRQYR